MSTPSPVHGQQQPGGADAPQGWRPPTNLHTERPHQARVYNSWLGGKDNFEADRAVAAAVEEVLPQIPVIARENRAFMHRAVRYLADRGVWQFLDIGTGLPLAPNLHEVVQEVAPSSRVVYVDNDPLVLSHARALLTSHPDGRTAYIDADVRRPQSILHHPELLETLDLARPVALSLVAVMHFIRDEHNAFGIVHELVRALAPGSFLVLSHVTAEHDPGPWDAAVRAYPMPVQPRTRDQILKGFFTGLELEPPGVVLADRWHPDPGAADLLSPADVSLYAGVARVPDYLVT